MVGVETDEIVAVVLGGFDGKRRLLHNMAVKPPRQEEGYFDTASEDT